MLAGPDGSNVMRLTVVGCAPAWTQRVGRASSCYLLEHDGGAVVLDMGQGSFSALGQYRDVRQIDGVLISHLHADHLVDLVPLRHFVSYEAPDTRIRLHGPLELRRRFDAFQAQPDFLRVLPGDPLASDSFELAGLSVEARLVTHIPHSFGFRLAPSDGSGPGLVYSGDCAQPRDLLPLVRAGDTLLSEAAFGAGDTFGPGSASGDEPSGAVHMTAAQAAWAAAESGAARLVLTHILDRNDEAAARDAAAEVFDGELLVAQPGLQLDVSSTA
jgi:ribonuclease BN (tRNA processing enzyme)